MKRRTFTIVQPPYPESGSLDEAAAAAGGEFESASVAGRRFPRVCAHRGFSAACPENTLPAFAAALALGVDEIEFDLWLSADGVPVVCHDPRVDRTTDGVGEISRLDWGEIRRLDAGCRFGVEWRGVHVPRFEEVLALVQSRATLNIHLKDCGRDAGLVRKAGSIVEAHGLEENVYFAGDESVLDAARTYAPHIDRACLAHQDDGRRLVETARAFGCARVQFGRDVDDDSIRLAHESGMVCNLFFSDDEAEAADFARRGIDVVLSNRATLFHVDEAFSHGVSSGADDPSATGTDEEA